MSRVRAVAVAATAGSAAFIAWDANDRKGGVGVTRAVTATATAALIVADYKLCLAGLEKNSPPFLDARNRVHERSAARLLRLCERNGGLYTKAGQFISTASGMPAPYQRHLSKLQDSARPLEWSDVREMVANELSPRAVEHLVNFGGGNDARDAQALGATELSDEAAANAVKRSAGATNEPVLAGGVSGSTSFSEFDREPLAAASLAQVHRAVTSAGEEVAVKVQRPGLRRQFDVDLATMRFITGAICVAFPSFDFSFLVPEFRDRLSRELDFTWEGRSCERTGRALADDARMVTPKIHWSLTTGRVLTMEYVRGVKVDDGPGLRAAGIDPAAAASALADTFARMLACHGFVHGDPHPGNMLVRRQPSDLSAGGNDLGAAVMSPAEPSVLMSSRRRWWTFGSRAGGQPLTGKVQIVLLDHGLYTELNERERVRMCELWHAVAMRDPERVRGVSEEMGVPKSLQWILPQLMARQTSNVKPMGGGESGNADAPGGDPASANPRSAEAAQARVDGLVRGGRPPLSMDQVSEFGRALPREMMIVMRANALIRNITRKLAIDVDAHERAMYGEGTGGRGLLGLSLGGFMGGDVGRRMDRRRQWAMARYSCLGISLPSALAECGRRKGGIAALPMRIRIKWKLRTARVWARIWLFRSMQYGVMIAIRTLPEGLSEPVVQGFTEILERKRGGLPAA